MSKVELIKKLQEQLSGKEQELSTKVTELKTEYDTQKYINELLNMARKDITSLAEYVSVVKDNEKDKCIRLISNFLTTSEEIETIFQESKNLHFMKKRNFDRIGVPQYNKSKLIIEKFYQRLNQYNLTRNFKYTNINQINQLKTYLDRIIGAKTYFDNGKLVKEIIDIKEIEYIIENSELDEQEKTAIAFAIIEENNKYYIGKEGVTDASETN